MVRYHEYRTGSIRLNGWDYRRSAWYFLTICTHDRTRFFGDVRRGIVCLSRIGCVAHRFWAAIPNHSNRARLDAFIIMPNHVHGLIGLVPDDTAVETLDPTSLRDDAGGHDLDINQHMSAISPKPGSVSTIVRSYKSAVTRWARRNGYPDFAWQPRFYDHIVRNRRAFHRIRQYIANNPTRWHQDRHRVR